MTESFLQRREFKEDLKKVGPGAKFWYRSIFDPITEEQYYMIYDLENPGMCE